MGGRRGCAVRTVLLIVFAVLAVAMLASLLAGLLLTAAFVVQQARVWVGSRREMDRQLADLLRERR